jgi:hypothetical protein
MPVAEGLAQATEVYPSGQVGFNEGGVPPVLRPLKLNEAVKLRPAKPHGRLISFWRKRNHKK